MPHCPPWMPRFSRISLEHCDTVFFLVSAYFACDAHPLGQFLDDIVVTFVNLLA